MEFVMAGHRLGSAIRTRVPGMTRWVKSYFASPLFSSNRDASLPRNDATCGLEHLDAGALQMSILGEVAAKGARPRLTMEQPEDVARQLIEARAAGKLVRDVRHELVEHLGTRSLLLLRTEQGAIH